MSDEELEVLITIDDPWYGPDEDTFHLHPDIGIGADDNELLFAFTCK